MSVANQVNLPELYHRIEDGDDGVVILQGTWRRSGAEVDFELDNASVVPIWTDGPYSFTPGILNACRNAQENQTQ